jgi:hypothetical protein
MCRADNFLARTLLKEMKIAQTSPSQDLEQR